MSEIVFLEYTFMFKPSEGFAHLYEFEQALARFFSEKGLEASILKPVDGQNARRILYLCKKGQDKQTPNQPGRPKSTKGIIREMSNRPLRKSAGEYDKKKLNLDKPLKRIK